MFVFTTPRIIDPDPGEFTFDQRFRSPELAHLLGTDDQERDVFVRVLFEVQHSFEVGMVVAVIVLLTGLFLGILSRSNRHFTGILSKLREAVRSVPPILFVVALLLIYDGNLTTLLAATALSTLPPMVDNIASQFRQLQGSGFVEAARATGVTQSRILGRYLLPTCVATGLAQVGSTFAAAVIIEATISFLGFNPRPESISTGEMISYSSLFLASAPWAFFAPAMALTVTLLLAQPFSRGLRTEFKPELQALLTRP